MVNDNQHALKMLKGGKNANSIVIIQQTNQFVFICVVSSVKKTRRSKSRDKTSVEKKSPSEKKTADAINNKESTEDTWDLDIENEIDFDEIEADETKQNDEAKSDCGSTAGRSVDTGEMKTASAAKDTASKLNSKLIQKKI